MITVTSPINLMAHYVGVPLEHKGKLVRGYISYYIDNEKKPRWFIKSLKIAGDIYEVDPATVEQDKTSSTLRLLSIQYRGAIHANDMVECNAILKEINEIEKELNKYL